MANIQNNLLVLFYTALLDEKAIRKQMDHLTAIIKTMESPDEFCIANELVNRNSITSNRKKMLREAKHLRLRAFRFFLNKN